MLLLVADQLLVDDDACVSLDSLIVLDVLDDHSVGVLLVLLDCTVDVDDEDDEGENDDDDDGDGVCDELLLTELDSLDEIEDELGTFTSSSTRSSVFVHNRAKP